MILKIARIRSQRRAGKPVKPTAAVRRKRPKFPYWGRNGGAEGIRRGAKGSAVQGMLGMLGMLGGTYAEGKRKAGNSRQPPRVVSRVVGLVASSPFKMTSL